MSSKKIVAITFGVCIITVIGALVAIGAYFKNRYKKIKKLRNQLTLNILCISKEVILCAFVMQFVSPRIICLSS